MVSDETRTKILSAIDHRHDDIVNFLKDLVRFPSVSGNESEIQSFIAQYLSRMHLFVDKWEPNLEELKRHPGYLHVETSYENRPNVVGVYRGRGGGRSLLFNGHVDVIPAQPVSDWTHDPWTPYIENDRVYGRGTSDMKSGLAAMTMALDTVLKLGFEPKGDVILEYTVDEELSGNGTIACITKGYKADAGICCETSSLHVQPAAIGRIWFEINVRGKPAGIQRRWEGVSGIEKGYLVFKSINAFEETRIKKLQHPLYPDSREALPCSVGMFHAGTYPSAFPDSCTLKGSIATLPGENSEKVKRDFEDYLVMNSGTDQWLRNHKPEIRWKGYFAEPAEIPVDHPICKTVAHNLQIVTHSEPLVTGRMGAADIRHLVKFGSTPTVIFGPGLTSQMHATDEYVNLKDLMVATKTLALSILDWCGC